MGPGSSAARSVAVIAPVAGGLGSPLAIMSALNTPAISALNRLSGLPRRRGAAPPMLADDIFARC
jgi:hypothetical protein